MQARLTTPPWLSSQPATVTDCGRHYSANGKPQCCTLRCGGGGRWTLQGGTHPLELNNSLGVSHCAEVTLQFVAQSFMV